MGLIREGYLHWIQKFRLSLSGSFSFNSFFFCTFIMKLLCLLVSTIADENSAIILTVVLQYIMSLSSYFPGFLAHFSQALCFLVPCLQISVISAFPKLPFHSKSPTPYSLYCIGKCPTKKKKEKVNHYAHLMCFLSFTICPAFYLMLKVHCSVMLSNFIAVK